MKARETKKSLIDEYNVSITNYAGVQAEHIIKLRIMKTRILELEHMLVKYFVIINFFFTEEAEVDDVRF